MPDNPRMNRVVILPFLEERVGVKERFLRAVVIRRPTYSAAWCVIEGKDGHFRITNRGTGRYEDFWVTFDAGNKADAVDYEESRLWHRYARGPVLKAAAYVTTDAGEAREELKRVPDLAYDWDSGRYVVSPTPRWDTGQPPSED